MKKVEPRTLPGFMELLPTDQIMFNEIKEKIQKSYEKFGFFLFGLLIHTKTESPF